MPWLRERRRDRNAGDPTRRIHERRFWSASLRPSRPRHPHHRCHARQRHGRTVALQDRPIDSEADRSKSQVPPHRKGAQYRLRRDIQTLAHQILGHGVTVTDIIRDPETGEAFRDMAGMFHQGVVSIALDIGNQDKLFVLRHEAVHALRDAGVFSAGEWDILKRAVLRYPSMPPARMQGYFEYYNSLEQFSPDEVQELLLEEMIADHVAGRATEPLPPIPQRIIDKIRRFLEALANLLRGYGFKSVEDIVRGFETGEIGRRERGSGQQRFDRVMG
jgi:hypothetical protein